MRPVFLIGPGGVGKTTAGKSVANLLEQPFLDLDEEFCLCVQPIREFIAEFGYAAYVRRNSVLFHERMTDGSRVGVVALSSGFLVTDVEAAVVERNRATVAAAGLSVLLMPSQDFALSSKIVVERQLKRGFDLEREHQQNIFAARFEPYLGLGDIQVFSAEAVEKVALLIAQKILSMEARLNVPKGRGGGRRKHTSGLSPDLP